MPQLSIPTKVTGEQVTATEFNQVVTAANTNDTKLAGIATGATANSADATLLARANHTGTQSADTVIDGATNKAYTTAEKTKLSGVAVGATANDTDINLKARSNHTGTQSADTLTDGTTNKAFLATERTKLTGIATAATANSTDAALRDRSTHTGTQSADTLTDGTTNKAFLATERTKLTGIAAGATANSTDAVLKDRANHTGTQAQSTITNLLTDLGLKADLVAGKVPATQLPDFDLMADLDNTQFQQITQGGVAKASIIPSVLNGGASSIKTQLLAKRTMGWIFQADTTNRPVLNMAPNSITGTANAMTYGPTTGQFYSRQMRYGVDSAATANALCSVRTGLAQHSFTDGFDFSYRFMNGDAATVGTGHNFIGFTAATTDLVGTVEPSANVNIIGIGSDSTDANLQLMYNDASGTATKVDLGAGYPANTNFADIYTFNLICLPGAGNITYTVTRLSASTGAVVNTVTNTIPAGTTNLPAATQKMAIIAQRYNGATAAIVTLVHMIMLIEF